MRVVHVIAGLDVGGAEHFLRRLVIGAHSAGDAEHVVISLTTIGEVGRMLQAAGLHVEALGMQSALAMPGAIWRLRRRLRTFRPDIVQGWMYHGDLLGGLAARWAGVQKVVWGVRASRLVHGTSRTTLMTRWLCARLSARVPDVIVCAAEAGIRAHAAIGYDATKLRVIANGFAVADSDVAAGNANALRGELGWDADVQVVGIVGRFNPIKGIDIFVDMARIVHGRHPSARFLMVGRGFDVANAELMHWIEEAGLRTVIALVGERENVTEWLAAMNVFVLSSRAEGFPNVVGEAMASGVPCVVTNVGDAALLLGDTGSVVEPDNSSALGEAVIQMLNRSPIERQALGARARTRIREEYSVARAMALYDALYHELRSASAVTP